MVDTNKFVKLGGQTVSVEVVDTPESRRLGLSGRSELARGHGMLFIFPEDGLHSIWMKEMIFSIDVVWLSDEGIVIDTVSHVSPSTYPDIFSPKKVARYVLEVPSGFVEEYEVEIGDKASI